MSGACRGRAIWSISTGTMRPTAYSCPACGQRFRKWFVNKLIGTLGSWPVNLPDRLIGIHLTAACYGFLLADLTRCCLKVICHEDNMSGGGGAMATPSAHGAALRFCA